MRICCDDIGELYRLVEDRASADGLPQTLAALRFAYDAHDGQTRKGSGDRPYIIHPLKIAVSAIALGMINDDLLASILLHDVCEDCGIAPDGLPVDQQVRDAVQRLSRNYSSDHEHYYRSIAQDRIACIVKCLDRIDNMSDMSAVFSEDRMTEYALEAERYIHPLIEIAKRACSEWADALWMIDHQLETLINTYLNLLSGD